MSRVYFHTPSRPPAELHGSERAYLGGICNRVALGFVTSTNVDRCVNMLNPRHYLFSQVGAPMFAEHLRTAFSTADFGEHEPLLWKSKPIESGPLILNTALRVGNEQIQLAARIHAQCEIHGYVEGEDRPWLANIMQRGLDTEVYRRETRFTYADGKQSESTSQGWESVIALLRERDDEPVVMSYSVCERFPNSAVAGWEPEGYGTDAWNELPSDEMGRRWDAWYELPHDEAWRLGLEGLRAKQGGLRLQPDDFNDYVFGHRLSFLDIFADDYADRLNEAFA